MTVFKRSAAEFEPAAGMASGRVLSPRAVEHDKPNATGKRVLFVTHVGEPGGGELKMLDLCRAERENAEVLLFQHGSLEQALRAEHIRFSVLQIPKNAGAVRREDGLRSLLKAIPGALSMVRGLADVAKRFDVVVCFSQKAFVVASLAKPFMRRPIIWFMNDILSPEHFSPALIRVLVRLSRHTADHIVVNSQASLTAWREAGGREQRVSVIYPGVEQPVRASAAEITLYREKFAGNGTRLVGMFGRLCRWKGQHVFLEALAELPDTSAVLVGAALFGEREYENKLRDLVRKLNLENRVTFAGHVEHPMTIMAACDVVVHCSTAPEPFGLVIAEAMLVGTPVIASDAGGAREIVVQSETGQLAPAGDHRSLAAAVRRYLDQPQWAKDMAQRGKVRAQEKFSVAAMTDAFRRLMESCARCSKAAP